MEERVRAVGHEHVTATHGSTFEVTTDDYLTPAGDCILAINADRAPADFDPAFKSTCQDAEATIHAVFQVGDQVATVTGRGDPALTFADDRSMVGRTSEYVDDRTVMVQAETAASGLPRSMVESLAGGANLEMCLRVDGQV